MKRLMLSLVATAAAFAAVPAQAVVLDPGTSGLKFDAFVPATQGTRLAFTTVSGQALTFSTTMLSAVYLNTLGTLDFYYQIFQTGAGSTGKNQMIDQFTAADFSGWMVDGFVSAADPDGAGAFVAVNNPPSSTTSTGRSSTGVTVQTDFGTNGLTQGENSATYIFRTNATTFGAGTFGIIDGSTFSGVAFAPISPVPEPATWGLMLAGFGIVGSAMRRRQSRNAYAI